MLEAREVLSASGFAGNDCAPVIDLSGIDPALLVRTGGQAFAFNLPAAGATLTDQDLNGDPTGDTLRWLADPDTGTDFPGGDATMSPAGILSWTPPVVTEPTEFVVTVIGIDEGSPALADAARLTFTFLPENTEPDLAQPDDLSVEAGVAITPFNATAIDADGDTITYDIDDVAIDDGNGVFTSVSEGDRGDIAINPSTGLFTWTPPADLVPDGQRSVDVQVTLTATDSGTPALADAEAFIVTVNVNDAPELVSISDRAGTAGTEIVIPVEATDSSLDTLIFILTSNSPDSATITPTGATTAEIRYTPTAADFAADPAGLVELGVVVIDDGFGTKSDSEFFDITEANAVPTIDPIADRTFVAGQQSVFTFDFDDANASQVLTATLASGAPDGAVIEQAPGNRTAAFRWTPSAADADDNLITVVVTDNGVPAESNTESFTVTVEAAPELDPIASQDGFAGVPLTVDVLATDANASETYTFSLDQASLDAGLTITPTSAGAPTAQIDWTPAAATVTPQSVTVTVEDSFGLTDALTFDITVAEATPPTVVNQSELSMLFTTAVSSFDVVFSEAMGASASDISNYMLTIVGGSQDGQVVSLDSTVAASVDNTTFTLTTAGGDLADGIYRLELMGGVGGISDAQGEPLTGVTAFAFQVMVTA